MKKSNNESTKTNDNNVNVANKDESKKGTFKSGLIKKLVDKIKTRKTNKLKDAQDKDGLKDKNAINLSDILCDINTMSEQDIKNVCEDINKMNVKVGIDSKTIKLLSELKDNEKAKQLLQNLKISMDIDVNSISELRKSDFDNVRKMGCKIGKVYVNSGWDQAAEKGYTADKYDKIVTNAEKMLQKAIGNLPENASQRDKFMAIYNAVLNAEHYDYSALHKNSKSKYTSRNLEGFFLQGKSVCAGTADALKNLCECAGIEVEYVQGMARSKHENRSNYHAWIKANIDGEWFNADPTWDANKVGKKYEFCLKSDKDFYGHKEDRKYNPTYNRDRYSQTHRRTGETRTYKSCNRSVDTSELEAKYYNDDFNRKEINVEKVSQSVLDYARRHYQPVSSGQNTQLTFKQKLAEFLSKRKHLSNISFIKNFIEKNKVVKSSTKSMHGAKKSENSIPKVSKDVSQSYIKNVQQQKQQPVKNDVIQRQSR